MGGWPESDNMTISVQLNLTGTDTGTELGNYKLVIWSFGNLISKCSGITKILPPILVRTVLFNRSY